MDKFERYDFSSKGYIALLKQVINGEKSAADTVHEMIAASSATQDALDEIKGMNAADQEFVTATKAFIKELTAKVKGSSSADLEKLEEEYSKARKRVIVEPPVVIDPFLAEYEEFIAA